MREPDEKTLRLILSLRTSEPGFDALVQHVRDEYDRAKDDLVKVSEPVQFARLQGEARTLGQLLVCLTDGPRVLREQEQRRLNTQ